MRTAAIAFAISLLSVVPTRADPYLLPGPGTSGPATFPSYGNNYGNVGESGAYGGHAYRPHGYGYDHGYPDGYYSERERTRDFAREYAREQELIRQEREQRERRQREEFLEAQQKAKQAILNAQMRARNQAQGKGMSDVIRDRLRQ